MMRRLGDRRDRHCLVVKLANARHAMRRDFTVRVEAELRDARPKHRACRFQLVRGALAHEQTPADAAHQNGELIAVAGVTNPAGGLTCGERGARGQPVEIPAHQLRCPSFRHVAGKSHRPRAMVHGENGAHDVVVRMLRIENPEREQQARAGQAACVLVAEITFVKIQRRLAVKLEQHVAARTGDLPARSEFVPAAGAAMTDTDRRPVEADCRHHPPVRRTVRADQRFLKSRAVAGKSARNRNAFARRAGKPGNQFAAVHIEPVGQNEHADEVGRCQRAADRFAAGARMLRAMRRLAGHAQRRCVEADRNSGDLFVSDVVVADLTACAASENVRARKHGAQLAIARAAGERLPGTKKKHEIGFGPVAGSAFPARALAPR